jgi:hypothetical protein
MVTIDEKLRSSENLKRLEWFIPRRTSGSCPSCFAQAWIPGVPNSSMSDRIYPIEVFFCWRSVNDPDFMQSPSGALMIHVVDAGNFTQFCQMNARTGGHRNPNAGEYSL